MAATASQSFPTNSNEFAGMYSIVKFLGQGRFGEVSLVEHTNSKQQYALKKTAFGSAGQPDRIRVEVEANALARLEHVNIVRHFGSWAEEAHFCILMEFAARGDFAALLAKRWAEADAEGMRFLDEDEVMGYFLQLADGLGHVHSKKIIHRDLKPENIFVYADGTLKLGDFGISRILSASTMELARSQVGSPAYMAPEIIHGASYSYKSDIWSLGVLLYRSSSNKYPFDGTNLAQLALKITAGSFPPLSPKYSPLLHHLVASMLQIEPEQRAGTADVLGLSIVNEHRAQLRSRKGTAAGAHASPAAPVAAPATAPAAAASSAAVVGGEGAASSSIPVKLTRFQSLRSFPSSLSRSLSSGLGSLLGSSSRLSRGFGGSRGGSIGDGADDGDQAEGGSDGAAGRFAVERDAKRKGKRKKKRPASAPSRAAGKLAAGSGGGADRVSPSPRAASTARPVSSHAGRDKGFSRARQEEDRKIDKIWSAAKSRVAKYVANHGELPTAIKSAGAIPAAGGRRRAKSERPARAGAGKASSGVKKAATERSTRPPKQPVPAAATSAASVPKPKNGGKSATRTDEGQLAPAPAGRSDAFLDRLGDAEKRDAEKKASALSVLKA